MLQRIIVTAILVIVATGCGGLPNEISSQPTELSLQDISLQETQTALQKAQTALQETQSTLSGIPPTNVPATSIPKPPATPRPTRTPAPTQEPTISGEITSVNMEFDTFDGGVKGLKILTTFSVNNAKNKTLKMTAYFYNDDGNPLKGTDDMYTTSERDVAVSRDFEPIQSKQRYVDFELFIPYEALGFGDQSVDVNIDFIVQLYNPEEEKFFAKSTTNTFNFSQTGEDDNDSLEASLRRLGCARANESEYINGRYSVEFTANTVQHKGVLDMQGELGTMIIEYYNPRTQKTDRVQQTMFLANCTDGLKLFGINPVIPGTNTTHPSYIADNIRIRRNTDGSVDLENCDDQSICAPVMMKLLDS
ncbi:MAG: hypothetical protein OHK0022_17760 [Roseiflexaceae bacterium]